MTRWLSSLLLALACTVPVGAGLFRVWVHQDAVRLGYQLSEQEARRRELRELGKSLEVELSAERSPERLMRLAQTLGLRAPTPKQVLGRAHKRDAKKGAGGPRG